MEIKQESKKDEGCKIMLKNDGFLFSLSTFSSGDL